MHVGSSNCVSIEQAIVSYGFCLPLLDVACLPLTCSASAAHGLLKLRRETSCVTLLGPTRSWAHASNNMAKQ